MCLQAGPPASAATNNCSSDASSAGVQCVCASGCSLFFLSAFWDTAQAHAAGDERQQQQQQQRRKVIVGCSLQRQKRILVANGLNRKSSLLLIFLSLLLSGLAAIPLRYLVFWRQRASFPSPAPVHLPMATMSSALSLHLSNPHCTRLPSPSPRYKFRSKLYYCRPLAHTPPLTKKRVVVALQARHGPARRWS